MAMQLMAGREDETAVEGNGGGYYLWSNSTTPLLSQFKLGASKLLLHPNGLALPHHADSSKIGYVVQGSCTVGMVQPNSSEEKVVVIKKGDAVPVPIGVISWWFNGGDTDVMIVFLGETSKALVPGQFTYFFLAGTLGLLSGFQSDFVARIFNLEETEADTILNSQHASLMLKVEEGISFPEASKHISLFSSEKLYAAIVTPSPDVVMKGAGMINSLTEDKVPVLGGIGLSGRFVKLEGNAMLAPIFTADGSVTLNYVVNGSGEVRVVGGSGKANLKSRIEEGDVFIVPQFFAAAMAADECGMELFSVLTSSKPVFWRIGWRAIVLECMFT